MSERPDPHVLARFLAKQIIRSAKTGAPAEEDLAKAISEVELQTEIAGASFIKVTVIDPEWAITTSGWLEVVEGLVHQVEVEFPEKSGWFWRLCAVDGTTDPTQPNITLIFEDRIVAFLRDYWGPKTAPPGTSTRAQFIRDMVREVGHHGEPPIDFRCKAINKVQPVEVSREEKTEKLQTAADKATGEAKANKEAGVNAGSPVTVKGQKLTPQQVTEANKLLSVADGLNAPTVAKEALLFAAIAESSIGAAASAFTPNSAGYYGVLQGSAKTWPDPHDTAGMATSFLLGGKGFQGGGAIALARTVSDPIEIAVRVEVPSIWPDNAYSREAGYPSFLPEAKTLVAAGGGASETVATENVSDVGQLTRGTIDNPDEDSWECSTRLSQQVTWFLFSAGNSLFYMTGPELVKQRPALHVDVPANRVTKPNGHIEDSVLQVPLSYSFDNTTFEYRRTHKVKGKVQRRSRASKPSTPAEVRVNIVCDLKDYRAGEVIEFRNSGPINGRWIIANATRNCLKDFHTQLILQPPIEPLPEPKATTSGETTATATGGLESVEGYVNPFSKISNLTPERIDMGVDYAGNGTIIALGDAKVFEAINTSGWEGGAFLGLTLTSGPYAGKSYYHAENLTVLVKAGDTVKAGQPIATLHGGSESGWASGQPQQALAAALGQQGTGDPGGVESPAGVSFNKLLVALNCKSGTKNPGGLSKNGKPLPAGYP